MPENCSKPFIITFRELLPERSVYGHDGRAINRHSSRTYIHFEPSDEGCTARAALSVSKTLDGVPPAHLVGVTTFPPLLSIWYRCFGKPMSEYWMYT
jgi:hypothetical protein